MSLKAFHVLFIAVAAVMAFGFGVWSFVEAPKTSLNVAMGVGSLVAGVLLVVYGTQFVRKMKTLCLAVALTGVLCASDVWACSTCFGDPSSPQVEGMNSAIGVLLATIGAVLSGMVVFFVHLWRHSKEEMDLR